MGCTTDDDHADQRRADAYHYPTGRPYGTQITFAAGQVLDVEPGSDWGNAIGLANLSTLSGELLADDQDAASGDGTEN